MSKKVQRELICKNPSCGKVVAVSYHMPGPEDNPAWSHHWCAVADCELDDEGTPHCTCGEIIMYHALRVRNA